MGQRTPGPWSWWYGERKEEVHSEPLRLLDDETCECVLAPAICLDNIDGQGQLCACLELDSAEDGRIIAASPQLLKACRAALLWIESDEATYGRRFPTGDTIRAAIALCERE